MRYKVNGSVVKVHNLSDINWEDVQTISGNFSQITPNTDIDAIPDLPIMFIDSNMARVAKKSNWTYQNCNDTQEELEPEPTEEQREESHIENLFFELDNVRPVYAPLIAKKFKARFPIDKTVGILSSDGDEVVVENPGGRWK